MNPRFPVPEATPVTRTLYTPLICSYWEKAVRAAGEALDDSGKGTWFRLEVSKSISGDALDAALGKPGKNQNGKKNGKKCIPGRGNSRCQGPEAARTWHIEGMQEGPCGWSPAHKSCPFL